MNRYKVQSGGREFDITAHAYDISGDGRLELFDFDDKSLPIDVAVFDKWDFCLVVQREVDEPR